MLAVWAAKISEKSKCTHLSPPGCDLGGENCIKRLIQVSCTILQARLEKIFLLYAEPMERRRPTICFVQQLKKKAIK